MVTCFGGFVFRGVVLELGVYFWVFRLYKASLGCILCFIGLCSSWAEIRLFNKICRLKKNVKVETNSNMPCIRLNLIILNMDLQWMHADPYWIFTTIIKFFFFLKRDNKWYSLIRASTSYTLCNFLSLLYFFHNY